MLAIRRISVGYILRLSLLFAVISMTQNFKTAGDSLEHLNHTGTSSSKNSIVDKVEEKRSQTTEILAQCPSGVECQKLGYPCITCQFNTSCLYGELTTAYCTANVSCIGNREFKLPMLCRYCYQTDAGTEHFCEPSAKCVSVASPRATYRSNCSVHSDVLCLGKRKFPKNVICNWTGGYRWSTALLLSITLGGFGADRFYLGHWQEGIGKLFSFGGLGVWTLVDVVLIWLHYLGPADGSLYI